MTGFEISNIFFPSSASISRFIAKCPGVNVTTQRKMFESGNEIHTEFTFDGAKFVVWEPFGDNSRFWIGPSDGETDTTTSTRKLREIVSSNWPGPISRMLSRVVPWLR